MPQHTDAIKESCAPMTTEELARRFNEIQSRCTGLLDRLNPDTAPYPSILAFASSRLDPGPVMKHFCEFYAQERQSLLAECAELPFLFERISSWPELPRQDDNPARRGLDRLRSILKRPFRNLSSRSLEEKLRKISESADSLKVILRNPELFPESDSSLI